MIPTSEQDKMAEIIRMIGSQTNRTSIMSQQPPLLQPQPPRIPFLLSSSTASPQTTTTTTTTPTVANMNIHHHHHHNNNNNQNNNMFSVSLSPQQQQLRQQSPQLQQPFQQQQQQLPVHLQSYPSSISFMPQQPQPQQMSAFEKQQHQLMQQQQQLQKQYEQLQQQQLQFQQQQLQLQMQYEKISPNSCKHCRDSHRRCDRKLPSCTQCSKRSIQCHYVPSKKRKNESPAIILQHSQPSLLTTTGNNNKPKNNNSNTSSSSNDDSESDSNHNRIELMMSRPLKQARVEYNNNHHHTVEQSSSLFSSHVSSMMSSSSSLSTTTTSSSSSSNVHSPPLLSTIQQQQQQQQEVYQVLNQIPHLLASQQQPQQQQHQPSQITTLPHDNIMNHNNSNNLSSMKMNNNDNNSNNHSSSSIISNNDYQRLYLATSQISDKFITMTSREPIIQLSAAVAAVANSSSSSSFDTLQQQQQNSQSSLPSPSSSSSTASSINSPSPSYTSESSPINTSDSNGVAMVHQQHQQHSTPPPLLSLSSSPAVASVSILEACFDLIEPQNAGKDFKESVIAQLLWNQMTSKSSLASSSSSSSSTSPLSSSTANADDRSAIANMSREEQEQRAQQALEEKANQALWYSIQAVALLHMPSKEQEPYFDAQKRMMIYEIMSKKLGQYKATSQNDTTFFPCSFGVNTEFLLKRKRSEMEADNDENDSNDENDDENGENDIEDKDNGDKDNNELANAISELPDLARLFCKFSKLQLIETARLMFNSARTLLLDVEVFPHIGTHMKLAQTSAHLVSFLLVSGERTEEAHVFLNSAKVYLDRVRDVLRLDATKLSGHARDQLETQQLAIGGLYSAYTSLKSVLYVNYAPRTSDFYRKKSLKKYLKLSIRAWKAVGNTSRRVLWSQDCQNPLRKLKAIINRNPVDATHDRRQLYDFLMGCREMRGNVEHCSGFTRIWRLFTFTIDIFALEIFASQAGTCKDKSFFDVLWELQLETAHLVIREIYSSLGLVITAGARLLMIIKFTCRIHIEHSARLCSGSTNKKELLECLAFMHTDSLTLDAIGLRTPVAALQELSEQIKLQQQYHQQYLAQLDGSSWLTNAPNSTLSNQDNGKSDISLGSISNITSCDGDEKGEEPATQFFGSIYETFQSGGDFTQEQPVAEETNFFLEFFNLEEGFQ